MMNTKQLLASPLWIIPLPLLIGMFLGQMGKLDPWYQTLRKPFLQPPKIVFPIAWTILYLLIGASYYRVLIKAKLSSYAHPLIYAMVGHLLINYSYTPAFFRYKQILLSAIICLATLITAVYLYWTFQKYDTSGWASWLLVPYLGWLTFANYLAWSIVWLNR